MPDMNCDSSSCGSAGLMFAAGEEGCEGYEKMTGQT